MYKQFVLFFSSLVMLLTVGCSSATSSVREKHQKSYEKHYRLIIHAERRAAPPAQKVLRTTRNMAESGEIIRGGCWDYLHASFSRAGYPMGKRQTVFREGKNGPYASPSMLQAGDWLYHINHGYHGVEHSGMFIGWVDRSRKIGLMLSYAGEKRAEPARYKTYDLSSVYSIMRAVD